MIQGYGTCGSCSSNIIANKSQCCERDADQLNQTAEHAEHGPQSWHCFILRPRIIMLGCRKKMILLFFGVEISIIIMFRDKKN